MSSRATLIKNLAKLFLTLIECDKKCEIRKEVLCEIGEFEPYAAFEIIKLNEKDGFISITNLTKFLCKNAIVTTEADILNLLKSLKTKDPTKLLYSDFLNIVLPNKRKKLREKVLLRAQQQQQQQFKGKKKYKQGGLSEVEEKEEYSQLMKSKISFALAQVFDQELNLYTMSEKCRMAMSKDKNSGKEVNLIEAYTILDLKKKGIITRVGFLKFLNRNIANAKFTIEDMGCLFRRLDIDEDKSNLTYLEFVNSLIPWQKFDELQVKAQEEIDNLKLMSVNVDGDDNTHYQQVRSRNMLFQNKEDEETKQEKEGSNRREGGRSTLKNEDQIEEIRQAYKNQQQKLNEKNELAKKKTNKHQKKNQLCDKCGCCISRNQIEQNSFGQSLSLSSLNGGGSKLQSANKRRINNQSALYERKSNSQFQSSNSKSGIGKASGYDPYVKQDNYNKYSQQKKSVVRGDSEKARKFQQIVNLQLMKKEEKQNKNKNRSGSSMLKDRQEGEIKGQKYSQLMEDLELQFQQNKKSKERNQGKEVSQKSSLYTNTIESQSLKQTRNNLNLHKYNKSLFIDTPLQQKSIMNEKEGRDFKNPEEKINYKEDSDNDIRIQDVDDDGEGDLINSLEEQMKWDKYSILRRGYKSPMKGKEEEVFVNILKKQMKLEHELEILKQNLIIRNIQFNPVQAFKVFTNAPEKGRNLSIKNLFYAYKQFNLNLNEIEAELLMKRYDTNKDGWLTFTDLCDMIIPKDHRLCNEFNRRMPYETQLGADNLKEETIQDLRRIFKKIVEVENHNEEMKEFLAKRTFFSVEEAFKLFNNNLEEKVTQSEFQKILKCHGLIAFDNEIQRLFNRFDKDKDGMISFQDFEEEISPMKSKKRTKSSLGHY